jgi:hypothetical protein
VAGRASAGMRKGSRGTVSGAARALLPALPFVRSRSPDGSNRYGEVSEDQLFCVSQVMPVLAVPPWVESGAAALTV